MRINGRLTPINQNTILIRRGDLLIGAVNERDVISPLYDVSDVWVLYNLARNELQRTNFNELTELGVFENFVSVVRERSRSPRRRNI